MLVIPGRRCHTCEGPTRRELLRSGSIGLFGLNLANYFALKAATNKLEGSRGFNSAKSVIMIFLQGGPSHIDIWDPKPDAPANIRGEFKGIPTAIPGRLKVLAVRIAKQYKQVSPEKVPTEEFRRLAPRK